MPETVEFLSLCEQRSAVIRMIPDVKSRLALQVLEQVIYDVFRGEHDGVPPLELDEVRGAMESHPGRGLNDREVLTPKGARLLGKLFEAGLIEQRKKSSPRDLSALEAYIAREPDIRTEAEALVAAKAAEREMDEAASRDLEERAAHLAEHPEDARLEEISWSLIDKVFVKRFGYGRTGEIELAGCTCRKDLDRYVSNSGKTRDTSVRISWVTPDGTVYGDPESRRPNRRSDPDRNWGLGPE